MESPNFKILPPFPFPDQWDEMRNHQATNESIKWLIPSIPLHQLTSQIQCENRPYESTGSNAVKIVSSFNYLSEIAPSKVDCTKGELIECLEFNPEWISRFSKTLQRIKKNKMKAVRKKNKKSKSVS